MPYAVAEALTREECLALFPASRIGRVGVSIDALPAILPVTFMLAEDAVMFRASSKSNLFRASVGSVVAFEADGADEAGRFAWSILARGIAAEITERNELDLARSAWQDKWPLDQRRDRFILVPTTILTGRRFIELA